MRWPIARLYDDKAEAPVNKFDDAWVVLALMSLLPLLAVEGLIRFLLRPVVWFSVCVKKMKGDGHE